MIERIIFMVVALFAVVALGYFFFFSNGGFSKADTVVTNATLGNLPEDTIPTFTTASIPANHREQILSLKSTIEQMLASDKENCFANYGGFTFLGDHGTSLTLAYDSENSQTKFSVKGGNAGEQIITDLRFTINDLQPCVIAGNQEVVTNFNNKYILQSGTVSGSDHYPVSSLNILGSSGETVGENIGTAGTIATDVAAGVAGVGITEIKTCHEGNRIKVPELEGVVNGQCNNLEDGGMLYKSGNQICFFPTNYNTNNEDGLDRDYVGGTEENSLKSRSIKKEIPLC